jgi:hypothetical protein
MVGKFHNNQRLQNPAVSIPDFDQFSLFLCLLIYKLTENQLLELQHDLKTIFMIKKNDYIKDLDDEEIEEIKYYQRFFKKISNDTANEM